MAKCNNLRSRAKRAINTAAWSAKWRRLLGHKSWNLLLTGRPLK